MKIYFVVDLDPDYDAAEQLRDSKAFDSMEKAKEYIKDEIAKDNDLEYEIYVRDLL